MLVSIFSLSYFWRIFLTILAEASLFTLEKSQFCFLLLISLCSLEDLMILGVCQVLFSGFLFRQFQLSIHAFTKIWKRILQNTFSESEISVISRMGDFLNLKGRYTFHHIYLGKSTPQKNNIFLKFCNFRWESWQQQEYMLLQKGLQAGPDGQGFLTSGRDRSGTRKKVWVPGRVRTGSKENFEGKKHIYGR